MRRFLFLAFGAFVIFMVYMSNCGGCNDRPLAEKLERAMTQTRLVTYHDDDYDYTIKYPGKDFFILSGSLHSDTGQITGRRFYAKFVCHRKLWFVQTLTYPEECERAMSRLLKEIAAWQVW